MSLRSFRTVALVLSATTPGAAIATGEAEPPMEYVETIAAATVAPADAAPEALWTATAAGGISARDGGPDGTWQAMSLSRQVGRGYLRGTLMRYHGTLVQADAALPSDYVVGTVAAGGNFGGWVADGWLSYGRQDYGKIRTATGKRDSTGAEGSTYFAAGTDFGKVLQLGRNWYLTPTLAASYAHGRLLRPAPNASGLSDMETSEPTWSADATLRLDRAFGARHSHYAGLSLSRNWTSNAISAVEPLVGANGSFTIDSVHYADNWFEASATVDLEVARNLRLDLFATRGFEMRSGDTTSAGASIRVSF